MTTRNFGTIHDVIVVGAGPGGLYAAWCLARNGIDVVIAEEHTVTGQPVHCTGILGVEAFDEFVLPSEAILNPLRKVTFFAPSGLTVDYETDRVEAVVVDRFRFDQSLTKMAQSAGAVLKLGQKVTGIDIQEDYVEVKTSRDQFPLRARACILASGATYGLQRQMGLGFPSIHLNSAQVETPVVNVESVELHLGKDVAPQGFAWIVPVERANGAHARIGLMCAGNTSDYFPRFLSNQGARLGLSRPETLQPRHKILPLFPIQKTYARRLLVIGDAAGLVKPTTGGGIYYSILSAAIATEVLDQALRKDDLGEDSLRRFELGWQAKLSEELKAQRKLRLLAQRLTDPEIEALFDLASTNGLLPLVRKTARFNEHRTFILALLRHSAGRILLRKMAG